MRDVLRVSDFSKGIATSIDPESLPEGFCQWSEELDPEKFGKLEARLGDSPVTGNRSALNNARQHAWLQRLDGKRDFVVWDNSTKKIRTLLDFYGTPSAVTNQVDSVNKATFNSINNSVYLGTADTLAANSVTRQKWAGYLNETGEKKRFGALIDQGIHVTDGRLAPPFGRTAYKIIATPNRFYTVQWNDTSLFIFDGAGAFVEEKQFPFVIRGICLEYGANKMWILFQNGSYGQVTRYSISPWAEDFTCQLFYEKIYRLEISDMEVTNDFLWFARHWDPDGATVEGRTANETRVYNYVFNVAKPIGNGTLTLADKTPKQTHTFTNPTGEDLNAESVLATMRQPLGVINFNNNIIGWISWGIQRYTSSPNWVNSHLVFREITNASGPSTSANAIVELIYSNDIVADFWGLLALGIKYSIYATHEADWYSWANPDSWGMGGPLFAFLCYPRIGNTSEYGLVGHYANPAPLITFTGDAHMIGVAYSKPPAIAKRFEVVYFFSGVTDGASSIYSWDIYGVQLEIRQHQDVAFIENTTGSGDESSPFKVGRRYFYKFSYVYDGYQESPISEYKMLFDPLASVDSISFTLRIKDVALLGRRVTDINVYRGEAITSAYSESIDAYRLVKRVPLEDGWVTLGSEARFHFTDTYELGPTYAANSEIAETLDHCDVHYGISTQTNNELFVGQCWVKDMPEAYMCVFKSKFNQFSKFDWTRDLVRLPEPPTALAAFNGRLYAFSLSNIYRINPQGMYIEDTMEGVGAINQDNVVVTDGGLFFRDTNNLYQITDSVLPIGAPIKHKFFATLGARTVYSLQDVTDGVLTWYGAKQVLLVIWGSRAFVYSPRFQRWDFWGLSGMVTGWFSGKDNEFYYGTSAGIHLLFSPTAPQKGWYWYSKEYILNDKTAKKVTVEINKSAVSTGNYPMVGYATTQNGGIGSVVTFVANTYFYKVAFYIDGSTGDNFSSFELVYRILKGRR